MAASPVVATLSAYSAEPGTWVTEAVSIAVIACSLFPRCPSPKLLNATLVAVYSTGSSRNTSRNSVPGTRYFAGMCRRLR